MNITRHIRRQMGLVIAPLIGLSLSGYFTYHLVEGERGLLAWVRLTDRVREAGIVRDQVHAQRVVEEHRVWLLGADHLDPDLLDEQARSTLNLTAPGEVVIMNGEPGK
jgi:cell division protein FtsB